MRRPDPAQRHRPLRPAFVLLAALALSGCASVNQAFDSNYSQELNQKGFRLLKKENYTDARPLFLHALQLDPRNQEARINLGLCYQKMGRVAEARKQYLEVIEYEKKEGDNKPVETTEGSKTTVLQVARENLLLLEENPHMVPEVPGGNASSVYPQ